MPVKPENLLDLIVMTLTFGMVLAVWLVGVILWLRQRARRARYIDKRLGFDGPEQGEKRVLRLWKDGHEQTTTVFNRRRPLFDRIEDACHRAGLDIPAPTLVFSTLSVCTLLFVAVLLLTENAALAAGTVLVALVLLRIWLQNRTAKNMTLFDTQLIEGLELAARSLRAGHPLVASFQLIADEIKPPVSTVFGEICQRQALGVSMDQALQSAAARAGSADLSLFAASVIIQIRSGGNLADMMDRLAWVIRERKRLNGRVRVLIAQTQLSKRILLSLPIALFLALNLLNPDYMEPMYNTPAGRVMLIIAVCGLVSGAWVMNRMASLRY